MSNEYTYEDLKARWEEFFEATRYRLKIIEVSTLYPELRSINVKYSDLDAFDPDMADFILQNPKMGVGAGEKVIKKLSRSGRDEVEIHLRMVDLPRDSRVEIRDLRSKHLGKLISIEGLLRKATEVRPKMTVAVFQCLRCEESIKVLQEGMNFKEPLECYENQGGCGKASSSTKFKLLTDESQYTDTQKVEIQESPEGLRGGAQPERLVGYLDDDIAGGISPGDRVILNGILQSVQKGTVNKSTLFEVNIDVTSVEFEEHEYEEVVIAPEDEQEILEEAMKGDVFESIIASISPTIYGYDIEKEAMALQLFGGVSKQLDDGTRIRGDIHVLLVGDPGVAKSQFLRYMSDLAPRGIYASGKSSSAAGLCVAPETTIRVAGEERQIGEFVEDNLRSPTEVEEGVWKDEVKGSGVESVSVNGTIAQRPLVAVWKIKTPSTLIELETESGKNISLTPETRLMCRNEDWSYDWKKASEIEIGTAVMFNVSNETPPGNVLNWTEIAGKRVREEPLPDHVYDLTVEGSHAFIANGFIVHNTAAAVKDEFGEGRWTLEAGALVLADKGVACVDELDKMTDQDRSSMHEAMESQTVSVAKAGITATLQCRCSILGAANPKYGRFEEHKYIADQINLPPALLSRFDLIFAMTDKPDAKLDTNITNHILKAHRRGEIRRYADLEEIEDMAAEEIMEQTDELSPEWSREFFRKYVAYSKRITPVLTEDAMEIIRNYYLRIRKKGEGQESSIPITARQLEAFVRLSEASARARLNSTVGEEDAKRAVRIVEYYLNKIAGQEGELDIDIITSGTSRSQREQITVIRRLIKELADRKKGVSVENLIQNAESEGISEDRLRILIKRLSETGEVYSPSAGYYKLAAEV